MSSDLHNLTQSNSINSSSNVGSRQLESNKNRTMTSSASFTIPKTLATPNGDDGGQSCAGSDIDTRNRRGSPNVKCMLDCDINNQASQPESAMDTSSLDVSKRNRKQTDTIEENSETNKVGIARPSVNEVKQKSVQMGPLNNKTQMEAARLDGPLLCSDSKLENNRSDGLNTNADKMQPLLVSSTNEKKIPQRKVSVFSLNGFPNIQMLDQQNLKTETIGDQFNSKVFAGQGEKNEFKHSVVPKQEPIKSAATEGPKNHRLVRQTTLGSTGSSRASSCDEPTIVAVPSKTASRCSGSIAGGCPPANGVDSNIYGLCGKQRPTNANPLAQQSEISSDIQRGTSSSSSNCSLDSIGWPMSTCAIKHQEECQKQLTEESLETRSGSLKSETPLDDEKLRATATISEKSVIPPPPFESIKNQLKRNSMPNAQSIQRHIDNIISQNEAVIDNCNLVSIRSYNSTSQRECFRCKQPSSHGSHEESQTQQDSGGCNNSEPKQQVPAFMMTRHARGNKRWSTNTMMAAPNGAQQPLVSCLSNGGSRGSSENSSGYSSVSSNSSLCQQQVIGSGNCPSKLHLTTNLQSETRVIAPNTRKQIERRRSYNLARAVSSASNQVPDEPSSCGNPFAPVDVRDAQPFGDPSLKQVATNTTCPSPTQQSEEEILIAENINKNIFLGLDTNRQRGEALSNQRVVFQEPAQLESAIENLSLRRIENENQNHRSKSVQYLGTIGHQFATTTLSVSDRRQPNLKLNQYQQLADYQEQQQVFLAALLMEKHRQQSLIAAQQIEIQSQAAIFCQQRQQEMIEQQQLEQLRLSQLAASIDERNEHQMALASAVANGSLPAYLAPRSLQLQNHHLLLANQYPDYFHNRFNNPALGHQPELVTPPIGATDFLSEQQALDSQLLKNFLSQVLSSRESEQEQAGVNNLEHGSELLTQSLDSAKPAHRCDACDISFWTKDLLSYHIMTQCTARFSPSQSRPSLAFSFAGPQSSSFKQTRCSPKQLSKSVSPPKKAEFSEITHGATTTVAPEVDGDRITNDTEEATIFSNIRRGISSSWKPMSSDISILKQQLLTAPTNAPHDTLPFKKRKISAPVMR